MSQQDLQKLVNRGIDAEEFLTYYNQMPYFRNLLGEMLKERAAMIVALPPNQGLVFAQARIEMEIIKAIIDRVKMDVAVGQQATKQIAGTDGGGIL